MPKVKARAVRCEDGTWQLIVTCCPYCNQRHIHDGGRADKPSRYGRRQVNCVNYVNEGYLLIPDGVEFVKNEVAHVARS